MIKTLLQRCMMFMPRHQCLRSIATDTLAASPAPALLQKMRADLKTAMRSKDTIRLNVLRTMLAEVTNASKTTSPIKTDIQLLSLLHKCLIQSRAAATEFGNANRNDLREKEVAQIAVLEEYAGGVKTVSKAEIRNEASKAIGVVKTSGQKLNLGSVIKALMNPGGALDGKPVDRAEVARVVRDMI